MNSWLKDCKPLGEIDLSPAISKVQIDAITWPRDNSRHWLGKPFSAAGRIQSRHILSDDPELARRINDLLALHADR
jgi:hypothetical protein